MNLCVIVPHYEHFEQFRAYLPRLLTLDLPLVIVDDASSDPVVVALGELLKAKCPDAIFLHHNSNKGKGGAVMTGLRSAIAAGYSHALQIDADGQHDISDVPALIAASKSHPASIICGQPVFDQNISALRYYARYITRSFTYVETLSTEICDALCGFRLYPLQPIVSILDSYRLGRRMAFDPEILVRAIWGDIRLVYVPVRVSYPGNGRSHFRYIGDNLEIAWMHMRLLTGMLIRLPALLRRIRMRRQGA